MKKKKVLSAFLALAMATSLFSACGDKDKSSEATSSAADTSASSSAEPVIRDATISMLLCDIATYPYNKDWMVLKTIKEKTGVTLDMTIVPEADYRTKRPAMFADPESLPDLISQFFPEAADNASGILLPISDYFDQMPNFKAFVEKYNLQAEIDSRRDSEGKMYYIPAKAHTSRYKSQQWLIRTDIFKKHNIKVPTTPEEIYEAGVKLKELYPNSTPITNRYGTGNILGGFTALFDTIGGWSIGNGTAYEEDTGKWVYAPMTDNYKNMAIYVNKLLKSGVLDPEWATTTPEDYERKIVEGNTFIMYDWSPNIVRYNLQGTQNNPEYNVEPIYPPKTEKGYGLSWEASWAQAVCVTAKTKDKDNFEDVLRYLDWCYSDEAEMLLTFGVEGETYKVRDDGIVDYIDRQNVDYNAVYGLNHNSLAYREHIDSFYSSFTPEQIKLQKKIIADNCIPPVDPASPLTVAQIEEVSIDSNDTLDIVNTEIAKMFAEGVTDEKWAAYVKKIEKFGNKISNMCNEEWAKRS